MSKLNRLQKMAKKLAAMQGADLPVYPAINGMVTVGTETFPTAQAAARALKERLRLESAARKEVMRHARRPH